MRSLTELKQILLGHGYSRQALAGVGAFTGTPIDRDQAIALTQEPTPLHTLVRLFFLRAPVSSQAAAAALAPFTLADLQSRGLIEAPSPGSNQCLASFAIIPFAGLLTLRDFEPHETGGPLRPDHVLGVGLATSILSTLTVRKPIRRALDIGAGQGFQAMVAASHAQQVIATDINTRALSVARLACEINGITNIDLREGSMLEPVANEDPFDLIVSNPPFIISPPHDLSCLGGAAEGDTLVESLLRAAPLRLTKDGYCCVVFNWHHREEDDWSERPRSWLARPGRDAWLIRLSSDSRENYARRWIQEAQLDAHGPAISFGDWMRYFDRLQVGRVSMGAAIIRRRMGRNWFRADELTIDRCDGEAGDQIARIFENQTALIELPPSEIAALSLGLIADHELTCRQRQTPGSGWSLVDASLRQSRGFDFELRLDSHAMRLLGRLDGLQPARTAISDMARELAADPEHAVAQSAGFLGKMLSLGFLEVVK